jgi:hypothetical protein
MSTHLLRFDIPNVGTLCIAWTICITTHTGLLLCINRLEIITDGGLIVRLKFPAYLQVLDMSSWQQREQLPEIFEGLVYPQESPKSSKVITAVQSWSPRINNPMIGEGTSKAPSKKRESQKVCRAQNIINTHLKWV